MTTRPTSRAPYRSSRDCSTSVEPSISNAERGLPAQAPSFWGVALGAKASPRPHAANSAQAAHSPNTASEHAKLSLCARSLGGCRCARRSRSARSSRSACATLSGSDSLSVRRAVSVHVLRPVCLAERALLHHETAHGLNLFAALGARHVGAATSVCRSKTHNPLSYRLPLTTSAQD